jgi:hypothetical protein
MAGSGIQGKLMGRNENNSGVSLERTRLLLL